MEDEQRAPQAWIEALEEARADVLAGRTVSADAVRQRLDESIARMLAAREHSGKDQPIAKPAVAE